jgi:hypothetical protein
MRVWAASDWATQRRSTVRGKLPRTARLAVSIGADLDPSKAKAYYEAHPSPSSNAFYRMQACRPNWPSTAASTPRRLPTKPM